MQINIKNLVDDVPCDQIVRELRWPDGIECPSCESSHIIKRGFDDMEPARQRDECEDCHIGRGKMSKNAFQRAFLDTLEYSIDARLERLG